MWLQLLFCLVPLTTPAAAQSPEVGVLDPQDQMVRGLVEGATTWNKFGESIALTASAGDQIIWRSSGSFTPMEVAGAYTIMYDSSTGVGDGSAGQGAKAVTIYHLDATGKQATFTHTLGSDGEDTTSQTGYGINRVAVSSTGTNDVNANAISIFDGSGNLQAIVPAGLGVTEQLIFHVPFDSTAVCKWLKLNGAKIAGGNGTIIEIEGWAYNRFVDSKFRVLLGDFDTDVQNHMEVTDPVGFRLNPGDVYYMTADTAADNAVVNGRFSCNVYKN